MSSEERKKILQMVEQGKITAEEAANLMHALDTDNAEAGEDVHETEPAAGFDGGETSSGHEFERVKARARNFAMIPLWIGTLIAVLSSWGLYSTQQNNGMNFWFYCLLFPLFLGIALI